MLICRTVAILQWTNFGTDEWTRGVKHHWESELVSIKHVADSATSNTQESTSSETIEESAHEHGLGVLGDSTRNEPDQEEREGHDVDVTSAIELKVVRSRKSLYMILNCGLTSDNGLKNRGPIPTMSLC